MSTTSPPAVHVPVVINTYKQRTMANVVRTSSNVPMATTVTDNNNNTWQVLKIHAQALRKRNSRRIQGTVTGSNVKGAPSPSRTMFIYRVDNDTRDDDMRAWISDYNVNIIHFKRLSHVDSKYNSHKLDVSVSDYISLYAPNQWSTGICIGQFYMPKSQRK